MSRHEYAWSTYFPLFKCCSGFAAIGPGVFGIAIRRERGEEFAVHEAGIAKDELATPFIAEDVPKKIIASLGHAGPVLWVLISLPQWRRYGRSLIGHSRIVSMRRLRNKLAVPLNSLLVSKNSLFVRVGNFTVLI